MTREVDAVSTLLNESWLSVSYSIKPNSLIQKAQISGSGLWLLSQLHLHSFQAHIVTLQNKFSIREHAIVFSASFFILPPLPEIPFSASPLSTRSTSTHSLSLSSSHPSRPQEDLGTPLIPTVLKRTQTVH